MAKKGNTKTKKNRFNKPSFLKDERIRFILGISSGLFTIYLGLAFVSFFFTGGADQSKLDIQLFDLLANSGIRVENWTGKTGAFLSNLLINKGFGIAACTILYVLTVLSIRLFGIKTQSLRKSVLYTLLFSIWCSVLLAFLFVDSTSTSFLYLGGTHGYFISEWLISLIGNVGTLFALIICFFTLIAFGFNNSVNNIKKLFKKKAKPEVNDLDLDDNDEYEEEDQFEPVIKNNETEDTISTELDINLEEEYIPNIKEEKEPVAETSEIELDIDSDFEEAPNTKIQNSEDDDLELTIETTRIKEESVSINHTPMEDFDPTLDLSNYNYPGLDLLEDHHINNSEVSKEELESNKIKIVDTLRNYKIEITQIKATIGPTVTLYEIVPAPGVRISKIKNLEDDIALSLAALGIRIIAPIPGRGTIGIEVPNRTPEIVSMKNIIASKKFQESKHALPVAMGKTISNETYTLDLAKMPHLLVAGATGQGKSVGLNAIITSLLYKKHPSQLKFVLIDPKKVELNIYSTIEKHFLAKLPEEEEAIITDIHKVIATLNSLCVEMDARYDLLKKAHARNIIEYNKKFVTRKLNPENGHRYLPYIVVIIDEFADLIMTAGKEVETPIARIAQLARAIGIHMIIATQRPSTNIITGVIKANFPARIAFKVASMIDSRTILDSPGANQLIGRGDMLISVGSDLVRVQCAFVDTPEVEALTQYIQKQQAYPSALMLPEFVAESSENTAEVDLQKRDALFEEAARLVVGSQQGSTSAIQRRFSIGYNRAGRIVDQLEAAGIVGPFEGSKARQVLVSDEYSLEKLLSQVLA
ncbi:S-DNA-T family DNA segregation ATPase FtsK/SpoIIIE [Ancylomarina subtilis]|uniref:S-DNA-T family DNA segregation ATPase FtsK/SpoIIIE n=1 Tax=Ancylomarina subtilis TaxID=1639035 RepID=A0A4Q7VHN3_9BACT|nr:DNA translocase FtsK [Ancylomarina subtilis]RZT95612.1 S-DNA-T family DNA segregation ATPase FtsK/SpoIIIE [Ancylomarina subtilis]